MNEPTDQSIELIGPGELDAGATIPQCLDNQFVSDRAFKHIQQYGVDYTDPEVKQIREADAKNEFIRSLIYSSQVVINRAFLNNNVFLYQHYMPDNPAGIEAFAQFLSKQVIVPYVMKERSFIEGLNISVDTVGNRAATALLDKIGGGVTCVRLAVEEHENATKTKALSFKFGAYLSGLKFLEDEQLSMMASELFTPEQLPLESERFDMFKKHLHHLADFAYGKGQGLNRQMVYEQFFNVPGRVKAASDNEKEIKDNVLNGRFRKPDATNPFLFEMKKLIDLRYNTNLPDLLNRYTFTPVGMPTRIALQNFEGSINAFQSEEVESLVDEALDRFSEIKQIFMAHTQRGMQLPLLKELSVADVRQIRELPEWYEFRDAQEKILVTPLNILNLLDDFQKKLNAFQQSLSNWYYRTYERPRTEARYANYVTIGLKVAGHLLCFGADFIPDASKDKKMMAKGASIILDHLDKSQKFKGYAVKLMVNVIDLGKRRLDAERSYSIDMINDSKTLTYEDLETLIGRYREIGGDPIDYPGQMADQGK